MIQLTDKEQKAITQLTDVIRWYAPSDAYKLYLFGSRARWQARTSSDYDIAIDGDTSLPWHDRMMILSAWEWLPYRADLIDLHEVDDRFRTDIQEYAMPLR